MRAVLIVVRIGIAGTVTVAAIGGHAEAEDRDHVVFLARLRHCFGFFRAGGALALQGLLNGQGAVPADGDIHGCSVGVPAAGVIGITAASRIASAATRISAARVTAAGITAARVTSWIAAAGKTDAATPAHPTSWSRWRRRAKFWIRSGSRAGSAWPCHPRRLRALPASR